ncbi:MAG: large subunit ribosomal protein [Actinomycetota bacterium]|jgi:large subunit ribosomal protein L29|nr:large subunit ribosomal protein [Actinomycetota bacterium]
MPTAISELREMDDDELVTRLAEARHELFNFRFQHVTGQLDNYARLGEVRKEIARINTLLREREIAAAEAGEAPAPAPEADDSPAATQARRARVLGSRRAARAARAAGAQDENEAESDQG